MGLLEDYLLKGSQEKKRKKKYFYLAKKSDFLISNKS